MVLEFRPPEDLVNAYLQRPSPGQEASAGIQQALQLYVQQKALQAQQANKNDDAYIAAFQAGGPELAAQIAARRGIKTPPSLPAAQPQMDQTQGELPPATGYSPQGQPMTMAEQPQMSPIVQASLNHPPHAQALGYQLPSQDQVGTWMNQGKYGQGKLDEAKKAKDLFTDKTKLPITPEKYAALQSGDKGALAQAFPEGIPSEYIGPSLSATARNVTVMPGPTGTPIRVSKAPGTPAENVDVPGVSNVANPIQTKLTPNEYKQFQSEVNDFDKDKTVADNRTMLNNMANVESMLNNYNPSLTGPIASRQARAIAGEVGALTDSDIARQSLDPSLLGRLKKAVSVAANGKLPQDQLNLLKQSIGAIRTGAQGRVHSVAFERANRLSRNFGGKVSPDELMQSMNLPSNFSSSQPQQTQSNAPTVTSQEQWVALPSGTDYIDAQGNPHRKK